MSTARTSGVDVGLSHRRHRSHIARAHTREHGGRTAWWVSLSEAIVGDS